MSKYLGPEGEAIRLWFISHGNKAMADQWASQLAMKLIEGEPLNSAERWAIAGGLFACVKNDEAMKFFNRGKKPDARNRLNDDFALYEIANKHRAAEMSKVDAVEEAGKELGYPDEFKDEWVSTALHRYDSVQKSIKKPLEELRKCITVADALGGVIRPK